MNRALRPAALVAAGAIVAAVLPVATSSARTLGPQARTAEAIPFGCRASAVRVELGGSPIEPIVANNATYPCANAGGGLAALTVPNGAVGNLTAGPAGAFTYYTGSAGGQTAPGAAAVAQIQGVSIPTSNGVLTIVGPVQANASYKCVNDQVVGSGQSTLQVIYVNGNPQHLPAPGTPTTIQLGGGAYIAVNEKLTTPTSITERVLDVHLANGTEIVVGEAKVTDLGPNACAGTTGAPPVLEICPAGSTLDVVHQVCVIIYGSQRIIVSRPFQGPTGGRVLALGAARKKYHSPCLSGPGPKFAIVATKRGGRVRGTPRSDRILGLGALERIAGLGGNDCIDGKGGRQHIWDGNGKDRIYASAGFNRIGVGNGDDMVNGRNGSDWITAGNGNDRVWGGSGRSRIDLGIGRDRVYGGPSTNRVWVASGHALVQCGAGRNNTAFVRRSVMAYAMAHGCRHIHLLK